MDNQLIKKEEKLLGMLSAGITQAGEIEVSRVDRIGLNLELRDYKNKNGSVKFDELIKIPTDQRIPALADKDIKLTVLTIAVAITLAFEQLNLKQSMTSVQIVDLAEAIVESSEEDKLSVQDLLIFLQKLTRGEYGKLYESMDMAKFMGFFDTFRDERWNEGIRIRDQKHEEYKRLGGSDDYDRKYKRDGSPFGQYMQHFREKVQAINDEQKEVRGAKRDRK